MASGDDGRLADQRGPVKFLDGVNVDAAIEQMIAATLPEARQPGDVTIADYMRVAKQNGITIGDRQAEYRLNREVKEGRMERLRVWDNAAGLEITVWRSRAADNSETAEPVEVLGS